MDAESVIASFERLHAVRVSVHDPEGRFVNRLPEERLRHTHALCRTVKGSGQERACIRFDGPETRAACLAHPDGFAKVCHAGLVELVVPVVADGEVRWLLFAGAWRDEAVPAALRARRTELGLAAAPPFPAAWPDLVEALRCLAARLAALAPLALPAPLSRREAIERFIRMRHGEAVGLDDLARELGLSRSRASHAVGELLGAPFARLLAAARLDTAELLLRCTDLAVADIALRAGFGDLSHFHASFRRRFATSPAAWRKRVASA